MSTGQENTGRIALEHVNPGLVKILKRLPRQDLVTCSVCEAGAVSDQHGAVGKAQGMVGVVGGEDHSEAALRQGPDLAHDLAPVAEVETCGWLVEDYDP